MTYAKYVPQTKLYPCLNYSIYAINRYTSRGQQQRSRKLRARRWSKRMQRPPNLSLEHFLLMRTTLPLSCNESNSVIVLETARRLVLDMPDEYGLMYSPWILRSLLDHFRVQFGFLIKFSLHVTLYNHSNAPNPHKPLLPCSSCSCVFCKYHNL